MPGTGHLLKPATLAWRRREPSARASANAQLTQPITQIHQQSRGTSGALRVQAELTARGLPCGHHRLARLMRRSGLGGATGGGRSTPRGVILRPRRRPIWRERTVTAPTPNQLWIADITYLPTEEEGFLYLGVILDVFSRKVVGWSMQEHLRTELVLGALEMAIGKRRPGAGLIHHSDHGCQYTSLLFGERCATAGIQCSMGSVGDCFDNAKTLELFRHPGVRTAGPAFLPHPQRGPSSGVRIFGGVLSSAAAAFCTGVSGTSGVRPNVYNPHAGRRVK